MARRNTEASMIEAARLSDQVVNNISAHFEPSLQVGAYGEYRSREYRTRQFIYNWNMDSNPLTDGAKVGSPFQPSVQSPLLNGASFDDEKSTWFDKVSYVGAFNATDNWLSGWTNFDPQNTKY